MTITLPEVELTDIAGRVRNGADFLDERLEGLPWRKHINLQSLNMLSGELCVLGQLQSKFHLGSPPSHDDSSYMSALRGLGVDTYEAWRWGFNKQVYSEAEPWDIYDRLRGAWIQELLPF